MAKKQKKSAITQESPTIASQSTSKKIGFFSAMLIVMGSSIGAGIFFKAKGVLESSQGSLVFAILAWLIAAFAVIAMALALVEIASARNDNLSLIGWCKVFNSRFIYKASKNFMFYIYLPLTYFFMPLYVIQSIMDAIPSFNGPTSPDNTFMIGDGHADWVIWTIISLLISLFFIFVSGMSSRAGNIMNKGIMAIKFFPLITTVIIGFMIAAWPLYGSHVSAGPVPSTNLENITSKYNPTELGFMTPGIGLFMAVGAIFFAYDGFYVTAGIQSEMKEPKKTPLAIVFGLGAVTLIYLLIAIAMSIGGNGGLFGFQDWLVEQNAGWVLGLINLTIAIGVLGIINGFAMWAPRFVEDLIKEHELPLSHKFLNKLNANRPMIGIYYSLVITLPVVLVFTVIGAEAYYNGYDLDYGTTQIGSLLTFCDLTGTWTAVFAFMFIMLPIFGGLRNRKEHFVVTEQRKEFVPLAWISVIIIGIVLALLFLDAFVNVFYLINLATPGWKDSTVAMSFGLTKGTETDKIIVSTATLEAWGTNAMANINQLVPEGWILDPTPTKVSNYDFLIGGKDGIIGRSMKLATLIIYGALMILPTIIEDRIHIKKYGSIEAYEKALGIESTTIAKVAVY